MRDFLNYLIDFDISSNRSAIDKNHNLLLFGVVVSAKPTKILEFGVGMGFVTRALLAGIKYNGCGSLTSVDSCLDFYGIEPQHFLELRKLGADIIISTENDFVKSQPEKSFDFLISDADHKSCYERLDETLKLLKNGSFIFFHDTNLPNLKSIATLLYNRGIISHQFDKSTLPDERCERGLLMAVYRY